MIFDLHTTSKRSRFMARVSSIMRNSTMIDKSLSAVEVVPATVGTHQLHHAAVGRAFEKQWAFLFSQFRMAKWKRLEASV
jgi:hypothetical protein